MEALILSCGTGGGHNAAGKAIKEELTLRGHNAVMINPYNLAGEKLPKRVDGAYIKLATDARALLDLCIRWAKRFASCPASLLYTGPMVLWRSVWKNIYHQITTT